MLTAIEANEPILSSKITGPGQRATLSAMIADGMRAVTIRVNDVEGVAGFVLPGDRVDVALTRQGDKSASTSTDVVLQNVKVLAIDQIADERADKPSIARAVTLEVDTNSAQKLALASPVGTLSLMLRKAGEATSENRAASRWAICSATARRVGRTESAIRDHRRAARGQARRRQRADGGLRRRRSGRPRGGAADEVSGRKEVSGKLTNGWGVQNDKERWASCRRRWPAAWGWTGRDQAGNRQAPQERAGSSPRSPRWRPWHRPC